MFIDLYADITIVGLIDCCMFGCISFLILRFYYLIKTLPKLKKKVLIVSWCFVNKKKLKNKIVKIVSKAARDKNKKLIF